MVEQNASMKDKSVPTTGESSVERDHMRFEIARLVSVLIALVGLAVAYWSPSAGVFHFTLVFVVLPLGCIWYGREIGGFATDAEDDASNPLGSLITYVGWIMLCGMDAVLFLM